VGALLLLWAGYRYVLPWAGEQAVAAAPVEWEEKLGESAALQMLQGEAVVGSGRGAEAVDAVSRRLQAALEGSPYRYRVSVVRSDLVNAGALPGGRIFVFTGLLKRCESADEFAAVLAHEMMHVERRHGMKNLGRQAAIGTFLALLGSPDSLGLALGTQAAGLKYQRGDEEEADEGGLRLMAKAGFDAREAAAFFEKIGRQEGGRRLPEYLSTHPDPAGRARRLEEMARGLAAEGSPPMSARAWRAAIAELP
jgi:predicted Zn-dependent protease